MMNYKILFLFLVTLCKADAPQKNDLKIEKKIVMVMPSYNNAHWYKQNLDSVFSQTYENWHIIYIDDASVDGTAQLVRHYAQECGKEDKITIIENKQRKGALANHYRAVHMCDDWDIICQLDGDDWFAHDDVLQLINQTYQDENIWVTYGSFKRWPTEQMGYSKPLPQEVIDKKLYRETYWTPGQLRTFYAWLFKKIKLEDLLWDHWDDHYGKFYPAAADLAFSYPLIEMAGTHFKFISEILYIHNVHTPLNDFKVNRLPQIIASQILLHKKKYDALEKAPERKIKAVRPEAKKVDIFIFNNDSNIKLESLITQCRSSVKQVHKIFLVDIIDYTITEYQEGKEPIVCLYDSLKTLFLKELHNWWKSSEYVLFLDSHAKILNTFDTDLWIEMLEDSQAYAYFPSLRVSSTLKQAPFVMLDEQICAWRLCYLDRQWMRGPAKFNVLMHKKLLRERITYLDDELIKNSLLKNVFAPGMLMIQDGTITRIGLCGVTPQVI